MPDVLDQDKLFDFLLSEFQNEKEASTFALKNNWIDVRDPKSWEIFAPKGKLPFHQYFPWHTNQDIFFAASWSDYIIPGEVFSLGMMNMNEAWVDGGGLKELFELCCINYDGAPLKSMNAVGQKVHMWGRESKDKADTSSLKMHCFDDGSFKFSSINTHLMKTKV